jgi:predicted kinase
MIPRFGAAARPADAPSQRRTCSSGSIESAVVRAGVAHSFATGLAAYLVVEAVADELLAGGLDVVVDAVSSVEPARDIWRRLATRHAVAMRVIVCETGDEALARARLASRDRGFAVGEPSWDDHEERRQEWTPWPEAHLVLDSGSSADENAGRALAWLG